MRAHPDELMRGYRALTSAAAQRPGSKAGAIIVVAIWISGAAALGWIVFSHWRNV
jgi:hypothetical protein